MSTGTYINKTIYDLPVVQSLGATDFILVGLTGNGGLAVIQRSYFGMTGPTGPTGPSVGTISFSHGPTNYADSATYYISDWPSSTASTSDGVTARVSSPYTGSITNVNLAVKIDGNTGTSEASTLIIYNVTTGTGATATNALDFTQNSLTNYSIAGSALPVSFGDVLQLQLLTPAWITNPTNVNLRATAKISITG